MLPHGVGLLTVFDCLITKVYNDIIPYIYMLANNVPMGWGIFSVLTPVNVNFPIHVCPRGGGGGYV